MLNNEIKMGKTVSLSESKLFNAFKELHTLELLEQAELTFYGSVTEYKSELIIDIDEMVVEFMIMQGEIIDTPNHSTIELCFYDTHSKDEELSECERLCKQIYLKARNEILSKWKSVN